MSRAPATSIPGDGLLEPVVGAERAAGRRARVRARNLAGYADYQRKVRTRLVPGVW